jgi:hypothetical protein
VFAGAESYPTKEVFSIRICPLDPGDHMLSQKLLVDVGDNTLPRQKPAISNLFPQDLPLIPLALFLFAHSP